MPAADKQGTRKKQIRKKPRPQVPHGPGGTLLRPAPKPKARPRPVVKAPSGDVGSGGGYNLKPAKKIERKRKRRQRTDVKDVKSATELNRGKAERDKNVLDARIKYLRRTRKPVVTLKQVLEAQSGASLSGKKRSGTPGASIDVATLGTPTVAGSGARLTSAIGSATIKDPKGVASGTAKGFRDAAVGFPGALVKIGKETVEGTAEGDPLRGVKNSAKDYGKDLDRRYGDLSKPGGVQRASKRIQKEGVAPEIFDASAVATGAGAAAGRALGRGAAAGKLGAKAEKVATAPRRKVRVSGGEAKDQAVSPNLIVAATQKAKDERRIKRQAKKVRRLDAAEAPVNVVLREAVEKGEVVPRRAAAKAGRAYAREKGRDRIRMQREQDREINRGARKELGKLSRDERAGFKYAMQLGLTPATAKVTLKKRLDQIQSERGDKTVLKKQDELPKIRRLIDRAERSFTPRLAEVVATEQKRLRNVTEGDPGLDPVQAQLRRYGPQAEALGVKRADGEGNASFLRRVKKAAASEGLARPGYFKSEKRSSMRYSEYAVGGARAVGKDKATEYKLFKEGRESTDPLVHEQALARGIKRKYNWNLVAKTFDGNSFAWGKNKSIESLRDELEKRNIDPNTVAFWNPARYYAKRPKDDVEHTGMGEEPVAEGLPDAVAAGAKSFDDLLKNPEDFKGTGGQGTWSVVPKSVYDEIHADTKPSGPYARAYDVVKGKQSRILLGLSPAWLQYQVASNALLTGLSGTGPVSAAKAQVWWKKLSEEEKAAVEPYIGVGSFRQDVQQTKIGAARTRFEGINHLADAYRAMKQTPFLQKLGRGNPLDLLFRVDNAQNNFFRRSVLYSQVRRDAYKRMGENTKAMAKLQNRMVGIAKLGPEDQMKAVIRDMPALERHAEHVNDFLGDYLTYTAKERRTIGRAVMFYGFLRFSLRFAFHTMPVKHPVMASITAQLGRMQTEEVRKLLGGEGMPWAEGKLYYAKDGKLQPMSVDLSRANPAVNALVNLRKPKDLVGFLPPLFVAALDQAYDKSSFTGKPYRVEGENQPRTDGSYGAGNRLRILIDDMAGLAAPYRALERSTQTGPQGDDSMLFSERATKYKRADIVRSIAAQEKRRPKGLGARLLKEFTPLVPREDYSPEIAASRRESLKHKKKQLKPKARTGSSGVPKWDGGGGSGVPKWDG
jgi:hypothetical protein